MNYSIQKPLWNDLKSRNVAVKASVLVFWMRNGSVSLSNISGNRKSTLSLIFLASLNQNYDSIKAFPFQFNQPWRFSIHSRTCRGVFISALEFWRGNRLTRALNADQIKWWRQSLICRENCQFVVGLNFSKNGWTKRSQKREAKFIVKNFIIKISLFESFSGKIKYKFYWCF